jgi:hypothetical protein
MTPSIKPRGERHAAGPGGRRARCTRVLVCLGALLVALDGRAQDPEDTDTPASEVESPQPSLAPADPDASPPWELRFGARLFAGAPDGVGVAALIHPRRWLRVHAGAAKNRLGYGVRGGLSVIPIELFVSPMLEVEYGHYFNADYGQLLTQLHGGSATSVATNIRTVDYDQVSASVGLEYSPSRYVTFFGGVGISYWLMGVKDVKSFIREAETDPDITSSPLAISLSSPVAKLGLLIYFN